MNVVPLNAATPAGTDQLAELALRRSAHAKPLTGAALRNASPEVQRAEVAQQFEAILVRQFLGPSLTKMLGSEKESGAASSVYGDLLTDSFSQQLTRGGGMGLSSVLAKQLAPRAARSALNASAPAATPPPS